MFVSYPFKVFAVKKTRSIRVRMLDMKVSPAKSVTGTIRVPGDKSISHRAAILAAMAEGKTRISNFSTAEDCRTTLRCLEQLGVRIDHESEDIVVAGAGKQGFQRSGEALDCGNSGTTARLLCGLLAGQSFDSVLTGDASLSKRPMQRVIEPLKMMGAEIDSSDGRLPLRIHGRQLHGIRYELPVASAQVKSCVLLAGLLADGKTTTVEQTPTRDHTERMLQWLGLDLERTGERAVALDGSATIKAKDISVPGDISSAIFFLVAAACLPGSAIAITDVGLNPTRTTFLDVLKETGVNIEFADVEEASNEPRGTLRVQGGLNRGRRLTIVGDRVAGSIDEIPILALIGTQIDGGLEVRDAGELRHKETDRIAAIVENLRRMNAAVEEFADGFVVERSDLKGASIDPRGDHRIAMAFAVAALLAEGESEIVGAECVDISFPGFFDTLASVVR